jgi:DNA polymerase III sliding clamp (beta) subunit (PCNA family)
MKVDKKQLKGALEIVKPGLANKETIEQTTSFAFLGDRVVTYNDEISISHPIAGLELTGAVQAEEMYQLLNKVKTDEIELTITDTEIQITSGRTTAGLALKLVKLPLEEVEGEKNWKALPKDFIHFAKFAMDSCSTDMSTPKLTCICAHSNGCIEGSDGYRIAKCQLKEEMPVKTFLVPSSFIPVLANLQPTKIAEGEGWIHFKTELNTEISCRIYDEEYPDTSSMTKVKGHTVLLPHSTSEVLDRAMVFSKRSHFLDEVVLIVIEKNRIKVSSESKAGWFKEEINIHYDGPQIAFKITPTLLKDILEETQACIYNDKALKFEGEGWVYVMALRYDVK